MYWLIGRLERWAVFLSCAGLIVMMLHVTFDVVCKYLFNHSMPLTIELVSNYYMVAVVLLPLAALERKGSSLIHVELAYERLSMRIRSVLLPVSQVVGAIYCGSASWAAWQPAMTHMRAGSYAGSKIIVSTWPAYFFPVFGFALLALALLTKAVRSVKYGIADDEGADEDSQWEVGKKDPEP